MEVTQSKPPEQGATAALCCHGYAASTGRVGYFKNTPEDLVGGVLSRSVQQQE